MKRLLATLGAGSAAFTTGKAPEEALVEKEMEKIPQEAGDTLAGEVTRRRVRVEDLDL